jgi:virginiamycin B lyase
VIKKVHGKKRRVRVCRKMPAKPALPSAGTITAQIPVGKDAGSIAFGFGSLWVRNQTDATVSRVDPQTNQVVATIPVGHGVGFIAAGEGAVWTNNFDDDSVSRIDPETNSVTATIDLGQDAAPATGIAITPGSVWVTGHHAGKLFRIDAATNTVVASIVVAPAGPNGAGSIQLSRGALWVATGFSGGFLLRVDPATGAVVARISVACNGAPGAADDTAVWVSSGICGQGSVTRIDPETNTVVATVSRNDLGGYPIGLADGLGALWGVVNRGRVGVNGEPDLLVRIDPATNRVAARLNLPQRAGLIPDVAVTAGAIWVTDYDQLLRIQPASGQRAEALRRVRSLRSLLRKRHGNTRPP